MLELIALVEGRAPDWQEAGVYVDSLVLAEVGDDLLLECGVDAEGRPREAWLAAVKERLRSDLEALRRELDDTHGDIELWELGGTRIYVAAGGSGCELDPASACGWLCRLGDSGALAAAGFERLRRADLLRLSSTS
jgi:hypothetical protein